MVLGLVAEIGIPARPEGPAVACRVRLSASEAHGAGLQQRWRQRRNWVAFGKFTAPGRRRRRGSSTSSHSADELSEGILNRLVRAQLSKGVKDKGKMHLLRFGSTTHRRLVLNGLAALGTTSKPG